MADFTLGLATSSSLRDHRRYSSTRQSFTFRKLMIRVVGMGGLKVLLTIVSLIVHYSVTLDIHVVAAVAGIVANVVVSSVACSDVVVARLRDRDRLWHRDEDRLGECNRMRHRHRMWYRYRLGHHQRYLLVQLNRDMLLHWHWHVLRHFHYLRHWNRHRMFHWYRKWDVMRHLERREEIRTGKY